MARMVSASSTPLGMVLMTLPQLSAADLQVVRSRVGAAVSLTAGSAEADAPNGSDYILEGLHQELRRRGLLGSGKRLPHRIIPVGYAAAAADVHEHFARYLGTMSAADWSALGQLLGEALARYLENRGVPMAPKTLLDNVSKIPLAVDAAFPGYLEAGVLPSCWRRG